MQDFILFGMQGSGKGTQGQILAAKLNLQVFETGGQLRKLAAEDSDLGKKVKGIIESGNLVSDEVVMEIVENFLKKTPATEGVIFDGIPRSESQYLMLEGEFEKFNRKPTALYIKLTEEEALKRLLGRKTCSKCGKIFGSKDNIAAATSCPVCGGELKIRADDTEEAIRTRLDVYAAQTLPVIEKYRAAGRLIEVDGSQPVEDVTTQILSQVEA
ncbi:MAG: nucleoside monophosphate kinase [Candidatus Gracilibacteria bacterium]|nr:nucleoside monophosphate kinase [Candidatus Gracilibacteria bacterium]